MVGTAAGLAGFLQMGMGAGAAQLVGVLQDAEPLAVYFVMAAAATLAALTHRLALRARANERYRWPAPPSLRQCRHLY
jgi:hypothetical protein